MLRLLGLESLDQLIDCTVPDAIRSDRGLEVCGPLTELQALDRLREHADLNQVFRSLIGMGYADCVIPPVIQRNILENPGWYTQYTPYQAEISQGRLEALLNFQTLVTDLTGMDLANSSLLDEGTAAAEAMSVSYSARGQKGKSSFFVSENCHPQTIDVITNRAGAIGVQLVVGNEADFEPDEAFFGGLLQFPCSDGLVFDYRPFAEKLRSAQALTVVAADLLALTILPAPGQWGADIVVGNSQRLGVPLGFGGPHAAYFATKDEFKRLIPGRIVGVSKDSAGEPALRLALQTREQHIRRDKATSNICTAQVLLAIMASMYSVFHGPEGLLQIARRTHRHARQLANGLKTCGISSHHEHFFDTLRFNPDDTAAVRQRALAAGFNFRYYEDGSVGISLDELTDGAEVEALLKVVAGTQSLPPQLDELEKDESFPAEMVRNDAFLTHPVFHSYRSETEFLRYVHRLQVRDLSLTRSMIPLGSCTMKLNATSEMVPITWAEWAGIHPFAPHQQTRGYRQLISELEEMLAEITGLPAVSLQPNSGAQGEFAGLMAIRGFHRAQGSTSRDVCLIPQSAHGTNPASAVMAGFRAVRVNCDTSGNVDLEDLRKKIESNRESLGALMVTYPSTHGVFEESIRQICDLVHDGGGQVYMDGANMNALVGICRPGEFGVDVCHLNLHKTFSIPHGGGGPGVGPIAVASHLAEYLPGHFHCLDESRKGGAVASAAWGSAGILPISWVYINLMGRQGLTDATKIAILNANYIAARLGPHYPVLYKGRNGMVAHECILDCRHFKRTVGVTVADIAKRLMDYGFHAPTISWPVVETMMVEPTESESKEELDRFCAAMIAIREEIREIELGIADPLRNPLKNAPHTAEMIASDSWDQPYSREKAAFPADWLRKDKYWTVCGRIDDTYGDRHLFCTCVPVEGFEK
jgi:glycine dehydrogenase